MINKTSINFFKGYLAGFITIWVIPKLFFSKLAFFYYDIVEIDLMKSNDTVSN